MISNKILQRKVSLASIFILLFVVLSSCNIKPVSQGPKPVEEEIRSAIITLKRDACFGTCPVYSLTIYGNGSVIYNGERFVKVTGYQNSQIPFEKVKEIVDEFYKINYFSLQDRYTSSITDLPSTTTSIQISGKTKSIYDYANAPKELGELERKIDEITNSSQWVR